MRKTIPYVITVVATLVAVLAVTVGVGVGQPTTSEGGPPSKVFMQTDTAVCSDDGIAQDLTLADPSHLLVYFTSRWKRLGVKKTGFLWFRLDGTDIPGWNFPGNETGHTLGTAMWTFEDVAAGTHTVSVHSEARVAGQKASAGLDQCALTVMVIPPE